jgi:proteasome lid subunit RPN8/RPN11
MMLFATPSSLIMGYKGVKLAMRDAISVSLNRTLENDLLSACRQRLPYETCGIVFGTESDGVVLADGYTIVRNRSISPIDAFSFDPEDWVSVYFQTQRNQRNIVGFFHSHPQNAAVPSLKDEQGALPWGTYWIVSFARGNDEIAVYRRDAEQGWVNLPIKREP